MKEATLFPSGRAISEALVIKTPNCDGAPALQDKGINILSSHFRRALCPRTWCTIQHACYRDSLPMVRRKPKRCPQGVHANKVQRKGERWLALQQMSNCRARAGPAIRSTVWFAISFILLEVF
jgi:hypothetical protein